MPKHFSRFAFSLILAGAAAAQPGKGIGGSAPSTTILMPRTYTLAPGANHLPATGLYRQIVVVIDATGTADCSSTGGGSSSSWCLWNGSTWVAVGGVSSDPSFTSLVIAGSGPGCFVGYGTDGLTFSALCANTAGTALYGPGLGYWLGVGSTGAALTMAQATTYYFGWAGSAVTTVGAVHRVYVPRAGTVKAAYGICIASNTPTTGNATLALRLNNTTDTTLTSSYAWNGVGGSASWSVTGLSVAVSAGDYLEIKWTTPTIWTTPATNPTCQGTLYVE